MMSELAQKKRCSNTSRRTLEMLKRYHEYYQPVFHNIIPRMLFEGRQKKQNAGQKSIQDIFGDDFLSRVQDHVLSDPSWGGYTDRTYERIKNGS